MNQPDAAALVRGQLLQAKEQGTGIAIEEFLDGALVIDKAGKILAKGDFAALQAQYANLPVRDHAGSFLLPSFFDTHIHFPQLDMMGRCAEELLLWLQNYTFPRESAFRGKTDFVRAAARNFVDELVSNGTSCAVAYSSSCGDATDVLFEEFDRRGVRALIGKVSMDRHCPPEISVDVKRDLAWTEELIGKWHGKNDRLYYALTPRFAPSCTDQMMGMLAGVYRTDKSLYLQTHYAENQNEINWVADLFPDSENYLDVYDSRGLLGPRTILAHSIHTTEADERMLKDRQVVISHCPTSNMFLGSGLFKGATYRAQGQRVTLGTDVGAGTSFSQWQTMNEAYKVAQLRQERVSPAELLALATFEGAKNLGLAHLGRLDVGCDADYQVVDPSARSILDRHVRLAQTADERLAALIHFADDRCLKELNIQGKVVHSRKG